MSYRVSLGLCLALLFVWSLPGTIALRTVLMLAATAALLPAPDRGEWRALLAANRTPLLLIAALSLWFLVQALLISRETDWALGELKGQWLPALAAFALGAALAVLASRQGGARVPLLTLALAIVLGVQAALVGALWPWLNEFTRLPPGSTLSEVKLEFTFMLNLLAALVIVDLFCRASGRGRLLGLRAAWSVGLLALAMFLTHLSQGRNGLLALVFLLLAGVALFLFDQRRRLGVGRVVVGVALALAILGGLAAGKYQTDPRWRDIAEGAAIGWSIEPGNFPDTENWPKLSDGRPVEHSTFVRAAFVHMGLRLIADDPAGYGYGRNAFGHALQARQASARGHAHSGWIDLGVGGGIPGLLLWAAFLGSLAWHGWRAFRDRADRHGLLLALVCAGHAFRMLVDSVNRDHMLQMFMFFAGLLLLLANPPGKAAPK